MLRPSDAERDHKLRRAVIRKDSLMRCLSVCSGWWNLQSSPGRIVEVMAEILIVFQVHEYIIKATLTHSASEAERLCSYLILWLYSDNL